MLRTDPRTAVCAPCLSSRSRFVNWKPLPGLEQRRRLCQGPNMAQSVLYHTLFHRNVKAALQKCPVRFTHSVLRRETGLNDKLSPRRVHCCLVGQSKLTLTLTQFNVTLRIFLVVLNSWFYNLNNSLHTQDIM